MSIHHKVGSELVEFASKVSFDQSSQKLTINGTQYQVESGLDKLHGNEGEVVYLSPSEIKKQSILRQDIYICENDEDVEASLNANFSLREVFDTWIPGGHADTNKWFGVTDYPASRFNIRSLNDMVKRNSDQDGPYQPKSYNQLINDVPLPNWRLQQWYWQDPNNTSVTSLVPTDACTKLVENDGGCGYNYWVYNEAISSILQTQNTQDTSFYISPLPYTSCELCVQLSSFGTDDDFIGLIPAYKEYPEQNTANAFMFLRHSVQNSQVSAIPNTNTSCLYWQMSNNTWQLQINGVGWQNEFTDPQTHGLNVSSLNIGDLSAPNCLPPLHQYVFSSMDASDPQYAAAMDIINNHAKNWVHTGGCILHMVRNGDKITAETSRLGETNITAERAAQTKIEIDLSKGVKTKAGNNINVEPMLAANGGAHIGFVTMSQRLTMFKILKYVVPKQILNIHTNELVTYNIDGTTTTQTGRWTNYVGVGRLVKNNATNKTFYVAANQFIKVVDPNSSDGGGDEGPNIEVVSTLPSSPDSSTFYFVTT